MSGSHAGQRPENAGHFPPQILESHGAKVIGIGGVFVIVAFHPHVTCAGGGNSSVVGYPPLALWVAGSSLAVVRSVDGGRGIDPGNETRDKVIGYSSGGWRFRIR